MTLTLGTEVWTERGGVHVGKIIDAFWKDGVVIVRCEKMNGEIFERKQEEILNIRTLYKITG